MYHRIHTVLYMFQVPDECIIICSLQTGTNWYIIVFLRMCHYKLVFSLEICNHLSCSVVSYMFHICGAQFCNYMRNCTEAIYFSRTNTFVVACSEKCIIESIQCCTCFRYQTSV